MYYETKFINEILELMASCDKLGLLYVVQKDYVKKNKWFKETTEIVYSLQVVRYAEESDEVETEGQSESETEPNQDGTV